MPLSLEQIGATLAGGATFVGGVGLGLRKLGLLRVGKSKNSNPTGKCPDHDCQREVIEIATSHKILVEQWRGTDKKVDGLKEDVSELKGMVGRLEVRS